MAEKKLEVAHDWTTEMWDWPLQHNDGIVKVINTPETFEVGLEVMSFTPKEIDVKVIGDDVAINCFHEDRSDKYGTITRQVHRCYKLPPDVDKASLKSKLQPNGILIINASKKK